MMRQYTSRQMMRKNERALGWTCTVELFGVSQLQARDSEWFPAGRTGNRR